MRIWCGGIIANGRVATSMRVVTALLWVVPAMGYTQYCKCACTEKASLVRVVEKCLDCTLKMCQNVCEEEVADIGVSCFQRESLTEQIVVYLFAAMVVVLVGVGMVRARGTR